jgi:ABC-type antimicrobial peptide transport system permease subunit
MILRSGILLCCVGLAIGVPLALASGHLLASMLFGVSPADPVTMAGAALGILGIGAFATYVPARRAAAIDPMVALRCE